jgi:hypothetical protein
MSDEALRKHLGECRKNATQVIKDKCIQYQNDMVGDEEFHAIMECIYGQAGYAEARVAELEAEVAALRAHYGEEPLRDAKGGGDE